MTPTETEKILELLASEYENSFRNLSADVIQTKRELWCDAFANIPFKLVKAAVTAIILTSTEKWAPKIGEVMQKVVELVTENPETESNDAWERVMNFVHSYPQDEYHDKYHLLNEDIRRVLSVSDLRQIANNSPSDNASFEKPRFKKDYCDRKTQRITEAIQTGSIAEIADRNKMERLGLIDTLRITE